LSGDTRQHGAVEASDALRAIERYGGLEAARLTKIRRQNPKAGETKSERNASSNTARPSAKRNAANMPNPSTAWTGSAQLSSAGRWTSNASGWLPIIWH